jgi:hypothetical protein
MVELTASVTTPMRAQIEIGLRSVGIIVTIRVSPVRVNAEFRLQRIAILTDPWGTYIEVTERLAP